MNMDCKRNKKNTKHLFLSLQPPSPLLKPEPTPPKELKNTLKALECEQELDNSYESFSHVTIPEDKATDLLLQIDCFRSVLELYQIYLESIMGAGKKVVLEIRKRFEDEYERLQKATEGFKRVVEKRKEEMAKSLLKQNLEEQQALFVENKDIIPRLQKLSKIQQEILKTSEAGKQVEENKRTNGQAEFSSLKTRLFDLSNELEKIIKFKAKKSIKSKTILCDLVELSNATKAIQLSNNSTDVSLEINKTEIWSIYERLKDIKRPIIVSLKSQLEPIPYCKISKYRLNMELIGCHKVEIPLGFDIDNSLTIMHPSGTHFYLYNNGLLLQYDSLNNVFLKKPINFSCFNTQKPAIVILEHYIYILGGLKNNNAIANSYKFNIITDKWSTISPMNVKRHSAGASVVDKDAICVCGGENERGRVLNTIEIFNIRDNIWKPCRLSVSTPRKFLCLASLERGKVIVLGGVNQKGEVIGEVEEIDLEQNIVRSLAASKNPKKNASVFTICDELLILGGDNKMLEKYSYNSDKWSYTNLNINEEGSLVFSILFDS